MKEQARAFPAWPTAPGNNATIVLFATHDRKAGGSGDVFTGMKGAEGIAPEEISAVEFTWHKNDQASAANGIRCYATDDGGTTWHETDLKDDANVATIGSAAPVQVRALAAGEEWRETFVVSHLKGFCFEYTAGATGPTATTGWRGTIAIHRSALAVQR